MTKPEGRGNFIIVITWMCISSSPKSVCSRCCALQCNHKHYNLPKKNITAYSKLVHLTALQQRQCMLVTTKATVLLGDKLTVRQVLNVLAVRSKRVGAFASKFGKQFQLWTKNRKNVCHYNIIHPCKITWFSTGSCCSQSICRCSASPSLHVTISAGTLHITWSSFKVVSPSGVAAGSGISSSPSWIYFVHSCNKEYMSKNK